MPIKYSCFISYPHVTQGRYWDRIMVHLKEELENRLGPLVKETVYIDAQNINTGDDFEQALAKAICKSVCMLVVFTPLYRSSTYCLREFLAMQRVEEKRMVDLTKHGFKTQSRMIIPIVIKGDPDEDLPNKIKEIDYFDLTKILLRGRLDTLEFATKFLKIAQSIYKHSRSIKALEKKGLTQDCDLAKLPTDEEASDFWGVESAEEIDSSVPLSNEGKEIGFPLRTNSR